MLCSLGIQVPHANCPSRFARQLNSVVLIDVSSVISAIIERRGKGGEYFCNPDIRPCVSFGRSTSTPHDKPGWSQEL